MTTNIPIEDFFEDIIAKSMRGYHISESELAERTGVGRDILHRLCRGEFCDESALLKVAEALHLDPPALTMAASKVWRPRTVELEGVEIFNTPYRDMRVNAFLIWDPESRQGAAFDTGTDSKVLTDKASELGVSITQIFLTHTHNDHIADLDRLRSCCGEVKVYSNAAEPWPGTKTFSEGAEFSIGALTVKTFTTSGHSVGGTTYLVEGLGRPVAVVGDALFAGSMGGGMVSFADAWKNNREKILTLPDETVICPGHGPMSSVGEEKRNNPFFAGEFRS
jgi:glyoxylase-like metal-dependent hydrolase (beta-lactamase superfamily II)